jgi:hypothetical protein
MKDTLSLSLVMFIFAVSACTPQLTATPLPVMTEATQIPGTEVPAGKSYANSGFGFGFQFPSSWFGPEEYSSDQTLRVEVGSDNVYPYGTDPAERVYDLKNSYNVVIQYSKNDQNQIWKDTYKTLVNLKDGESVSDSRTLTIRVRQFSLGGFEGIEYISTLSETAQTEAVYVRQSILINSQTNDLITVMGQPINVEVSDGANWREIYKAIDEANLTIFRELVESITVNSTGVLELDKIVDAALRGDTDGLKSLMKFNPVKCTLAEGLGGPPKCQEGEQDGAVVEAFPMLDSEGHFLRKADLESWNGLDVSALFAVYEVSASAFSDENYPAGQYALVFVAADQVTSWTLQVDQGNIIRMDHGFGFPPSIPDRNVLRFLIEPR